MRQPSKVENQAFPGKSDVCREQLQQFTLVALVTPQPEITRNVKNSAVAMTLKACFHSSTIPQPLVCHRAFGQDAHHLDNPAFNHRVHPCNHPDNHRQQLQLCEILFLRITGGSGTGALRAKRAAINNYIK